jgi:hypothetical protein
LCNIPNREEHAKEKYEDEKEREGTPYWFLYILLPVTGILWSNGPITSDSVIILPRVRSLVIFWGNYKKLWNSPKRGKIFKIMWPHESLSEDLSNKYQYYNLI